MGNGERDMIPLELDQYKNDLVINQHIIQMINADIFWYQKTFRAILMELWKIRNEETIAQTSKELSEDKIHHYDESHAMFDDQRLYKREKTPQDDEVMKIVSVTSNAQKNWPRKCFQIDENENYKSAMMCWESLEDSEQESRKRKMIGRDKAMNNHKEKQDNEMDDKEHIQSTVYTGNQLKTSVKELKLGVDNNTLTLATQETLVKNLVYIMNIQEEKQGTMIDARNDGKNPSKQDDKKPTAKTSPLEKSISINRNNNFKDYGEFGIDNNPGRDKEWKKKTKNTQKVTHMEFDMDDDMGEQPKNANDVKAEGKVQVKKKTVHYDELSSEDESREQADLKKLRKPMLTWKIQVKMMKKIRLLTPMK